jgi:flagellar assembly factor FliW
MRPMTMNVSTTRFGSVTISEEDVITFADGLIGMEDCRRWVILADAQNSALGWMQSVDRPAVALAVVSPRRFVPEYQIRVSWRDIEPLKLTDTNAAQILTIVSQAENSLSLNLKAPLVIHLEQRLGRQIIARDDHAIQHRLAAPQRLRKTA